MMLLLSLHEVTNRWWFFLFSRRLDQYWPCGALSQPKSVSLQRQGPLEIVWLTCSKQAAQGHVLTDFFLFLWMQTPQLLWATSATVWLLLQKKNTFCLSEVFLCFSLCPLPLALPLGSTEKGLAQLSLFLPIKYLYKLIKLPTPRPSLFQVKQYQHPQPVLIPEVVQSLCDREPFYVLSLSWKST